MKALLTEFDGRADQRGFRFKQVDRRGLVSLFEKQKGAAAPTWEVVHLHQNAKREFPDGRVLEPCEAMPSPEEWGTGGYSCGTLERAREVFNREVERAETAVSAV